MKHKPILLLTILLIALMVTPTPAFAYSGVTGRVIDGSTGSGWTHGGSVLIINDTQGSIAGSGSLNPDGTFSVSYSIPPSLDNELYVYITLTPGSEGTPDPVSSDIYSEQSGARTYDVGDIQVGTGPNSIELVEFSVSPQSNSNTWLPFVLLAGSVVLLGGAVLVTRRLRA